MVGTIEFIIERLPEVQTPPVVTMARCSEGTTGAPSTSRSPACRSRRRMTAAWTCSGLTVLLARRYTAAPVTTPALSAKVVMREYPSRRGAASPRTRWATPMAPR